MSAGCGEAKGLCAVNDSAEVDTDYTVAVKIEATWSERDADLVCGRGHRMTGRDCGREFEVRRGHLGSGLEQNILVKGIMRLEECNKETVKLDFEEVMINKN